jgi:hypothetical protein
MTCSHSGEYKDAAFCDVEPLNLLEIGRCSALWLTHFCCCCILSWRVLLSVHQLKSCSCDGARLRLRTACSLWWLIVLFPDESECDRVSERDRIGLTPNLTARDLWSRRWARGNDNFVYSSLWDFKSSFTCRKILRHGTFPLYFPSERKVCCGFL